MSNCDCDGGQAWEAWHDRMPGKEPTLYVYGTAMCPTTGYSIELRRQEPQGINPLDLLLTVVEHAPSEPALDVLTPTPAGYSERTKFEYKTVSIVPDGPFSIPVKPVY
jgi:hypothetical protein